MSFESMPSSLLYFGSDVIAKMTVLILVVIFVDRVTRSRSAAFRHRLWAFTFVAIACLPVASYFMPGLPIAIVPASWVEPSAPSLAVSSIASDQRSAPPPETGSMLESAPWGSQASVESRVPTSFLRPEAGALASLPDENNQVSQQPAALRMESQKSKGMGGLAWVFTAWLFGAGIAILPLVLGIAATIYLQVTSRMIEERAVLQGFTEWCRKLGVRRGVRWLESERSVVPMTWGVWHPVVLVPSDWRRWSVDRTRLVVLHELAHVARLDVVYQALGRLVCSLFWFHPLVWYALKRLRVERELACDDCVVMAGELPSLYARQLVSIAREYQITVLPPAVAMAQRSGLENRIRSLLDQARSHSPLTQRVALVMVVVALLGVLGLAPIRFGTMAATMAQEKKVGSSSEGVTQGAKDRSLIVEGTVVGPDGAPIDGAEVAVYRTYQANTTWLYEHELLAQGKTSKSGSYRFEVPSKSKRFANRSHLEVQSTRVYASKEGLGPDERVVDASSPTQTLQLVSAKEVIQGRVVDLEGHPVAGVQVRVTSIDKPAVPIETWVEHAKKNPATMRDDSGLSLSSNGLSKGPQVAFFPAKESILTMGPRGALEAKTGPDGTFVLKGIGDGRQATLALQSPNIATALLHCVTLDMEPVNMPLMDPRYRVGKTFGSRFEFPCEPTQWIQGTVRDRHSGQPIPGIHVSLGQFADHLLSIDGFLETITDAQGRYLLKGIPKAPNGSRGVRLRFYPGPEQPYFRAERTVPKSSTLEPIEFNLEMTQSVWIEGRLQDAQTKKPLRGVLAYYPRRTNPNAKNHEAWDEGLHSMGYEDFQSTDEQGRFRIPALKGAGVVRVVVEKDSEYELVPSPESGRSMQKLDEKYYHISMPGNAMIDVDLAAEVTTKTLDIDVQPLPSRMVHVVDFEGKDVHRYAMGGRLPTKRPTLAGRGTGYWEQDLPESAMVRVMLGNDKEQKRPLMIYEASRQLGAIVSVASLAKEVDASHRVTLQPCVTLTGKIVHQGELVEQSNLFAGVGLTEVHGMLPKANEGYSMTVTQYPEYRVSTKVSWKEDGTFECVVPPGSNYSLVLTGTYNVVLFQDRELAPGQKVDLGTIDVAKDPKSWPKPIIASRNDSSSRSAMLVHTTTGQANTSSTTSSMPIFRGQVVLPDGRPAEGASLHFVFHQEGRGPDDTIPPAATTDALGRFEIRGLPSHCAGTAPEEMGLVASKSGYGIAQMPAMVFEESGFASNPRMAEAMKEVRQRYGTERMLRLVEDFPLTGQVLSTEGKPIANVRVSVRSLSSGQPNLDAWEAAANDPKADFYSLRAKVELLMMGYQMPSILPDARTDQEGKFTLRGIGRERIVNLMVSGRNIETMLVHARTRPGKLVRVPHSFGMKLEGILDETFYPSSFELIALPSVPIEGRIVDTDTGKPLTGFVISAGRAVTFSMVGKPHIATSTDKEGRYRLDGLSGSSNDQLYVIPPKGSRYLPAGMRVPSKRSGASIVLDVSLKAAPLLRGRVTDTTTGQPIKGAVQYVAMSNNPSLEHHPGFALSFFHEARTDELGNYEMAAMEGSGAITFRPDDHSMYRRFGANDRLEADRLLPSTDTTMYDTVPYWVLPGDYHHVERLTIGPGVTQKELSFALASGASFSVKVEFANGKVADQALLRGTLEPGGWYRTEKGSARIEGYFPDVGRELFAFDPETSQAAHVQLEGAQPSQMTIQLGPAGVIRGRLVDQLGVAMDGVQLISQTIPSDESGITSLRHTTDKEGRFELRGVVAGVPHSVWARVEGQGMLPVIKEMKIDPAKVLELGDVALDLK